MSAKEPKLTQQLMILVRFTAHSPSWSLHLINQLSSYLLTCIQTKVSGDIDNHDPVVQFLAERVSTVGSTISFGVKTFGERNNKALGRMQYYGFNFVELEVAGIDLKGTLL